MLAPVTPRNVTRGRAYGADRGGGVTHAGVDLFAAPGTPVVAPEGLTVLAVAVNDTTPPLAGYGPGAILAKGESGLWHVLGHLDAWGWSGAYAGRLPYKGRRYKAGDLVGTVSKLRHVHWEVRREPTPPTGPARMAATIDPLSLVSADPRTPAVDAAPGAGPRPAGGAGLLLLLAIAIMADDRRKP